MTQEPQSQKQSQKQRLLQTLKDLRPDKVTGAELADLLSIKKASVQSIIHTLKKQGHQIMSHKEPTQRKGCGGRAPVSYFYVPEEQAKACINQSKAVKDVTHIPSLVERCMHLIHARPSTSSGYVEDFFGINEEARVLLNQVARTYPTQIKLTITATVR